MPLTQTNKGKEHALTDHSDPPADDELSSASSPLPRRSPPQNNEEVESRKRPPRHSSWAICGTRHRMQKEASRTDPIRNWPLSTCLPGSRVWPPSFHLRSTHSERPPPRIQHFIPLFGDCTTCYLPPWANIFWIMSLLADSSYRCFPCTTAPLIHMIICCTLTRK